ncbi:hypothetical protein DFH06DRAFT_1147146 [Mycena polygramma]|nr:hypothetical protein DFH06DRAFT_1147146 [Mycena polygramma]
MIARSVKRRRDQPAAPPSSPPPPTGTPVRGSGTGDSDDPIGSSSSPVVPDEEDDDDDSSSVEWMKKRIVEAEAGLQVLKSQLHRLNAREPEAKLFLKSVKEHDVGGNLAAMAADIARYLRWLWIPGEISNSVAPFESSPGNRRQPARGAGSRRIDISWMNDHADDYSPMHWRRFLGYGFGYPGRGLQTWLTVERRADLRPSQNLKIRVKLLMLGGVSLGRTVCPPRDILNEIYDGRVPVRLVRVKPLMDNCWSGSRTAGVEKKNNGVRSKSEVYKKSFIQAQKRLTEKTSDRKIVGDQFRKPAKPQEFCQLADARRRYIERLHAKNHVLCGNQTVAEARPSVLAWSPLSRSVHVLFLKLYSGSPPSACHSGKFKVSGRPKIGPAPRQEKKWEFTTGCCLHTSLQVSPECSENAVSPRIEPKKETGFNHALRRRPREDVKRRAWGSACPKGIGRRSYSPMGVVDRRQTSALEAWLKFVYRT